MHYGHLGFQRKMTEGCLVDMGAGCPMKNQRPMGCLGVDIGAQVEAVAGVVHYPWPHRPKWANGVGG